MTATPNSNRGHAARMIRLEGMIRSIPRSEWEFERALTCLAAQGIEPKAAKETLLMIYAEAIPGFNSTL
jgi:hypothetical protein